MTKPKGSSSLRDCTSCPNKNTFAGDKVESTSFNGWFRKMRCQKCGEKWKQLFYRGAVQLEEM